MFVSLPQLYLDAAVRPTSLLRDEAPVLLADPLIPAILVLAGPSAEGDPTRDATSHNVPLA